MDATAARRSLTLHNQLPPDFPARASIEAAVRDALLSFSQSAWEVTLRRRDEPGDSDDAVEIELRSSRNAIAFMCIGGSDSPQQIAARLRLFGTTR